jgi:integral membrane protein
VSASAPSRTRTIFRAVAVAEAFSWAGLLVAMFFKWVVQEDPHSGIEGGVPVMGAIHGAVFVAYAVMCLVAWRQFRWSFTVAVLAGLSAIPPFVSVVFERKAAARGLLQRRADVPAPATA